jgi:hypothetical protein
VSVGDESDVDELLQGRCDAQPQFIGAQLEVRRQAAADVIERAGPLLKRLDEGGAFIVQQQRFA